MANLGTTSESNFIVQPSWESEPSLHPHGKMQIEAGSSMKLLLQTDDESLSAVLTLEWRLDGFVPEFS